jgi:hypothetical protein
MQVYRSSGMQVTGLRECTCKLEKECSDAVMQGCRSAGVQKSEKQRTGIKRTERVCENLGIWKCNSAEDRLPEPTNIGME